MIQVVDAPQAARSAGLWCDECGYPLRGLAAQLPCPECGHFTDSTELQVSPHTAWSRAVLAGLLILLWLTLQAVCSVLIQPFREDFGGATPALNMPGPKLWAVPLLQRPIGYRPEMPGVLGTRAAVLSLFALWLITVPCTSPRLAEVQTLRRLTRWVSVLVFGLAFGAITGTQGIWPQELPPYRASIVGCVELPGTLLLYLYLRALARRIPGRERRGLFNKLVWFVPLTIAGGAIMLATPWAVGNAPQDWGLPQLDSRALRLGIGALYGVAAVVCGVAATGAVGSLAAGLAGLAFPRAWNAVRAGRYLGKRIARKRAEVRWRPVAVAAGCALLIVSMVVGNDHVLWVDAGSRMGGALPFVNYPGPKIWMSTLLHSGGQWDSLVTSWELLVINLLAVWLLTVPQESTPRHDIFRSVVRWAPVFVAGVVYASKASIDSWLAGNDPQGRYWIEIYAVVLFVYELPVTLLMYWMLAQLAKEVSRPGLVRQFHALALVITCMVGLSLFTFVKSLHYTRSEMAWQVLIGGGLFGAIQMGSALWATKAVIQLGAEYFRRRDDSKEKPPRAGALNDLDQIVVAS